MKILILGGNRFFGKKLAHTMVKQGHYVTLLNRGKMDDGLGNQVQRIQVDRKNTQQLKEKIGHSTWDLIYDQICFEAPDAQAAIEIFKNKTDHYIFTSSQSVYDAGPHLKENLFSPEEYSFVKVASASTHYAEAKKQCEAVFAKSMLPNISIVRFPIVLGQDDYTQRLNFHIQSVKAEKPIYFPNKNAKISFINSDDAAASLEFIGRHSPCGTINVCAPHPIDLDELMKEIEKSTQKKVIYADTPIESQHSPFGIEKDWWMNTDKLKKLGFEASPISHWLPQLIRPK